MRVWLITIGEPLPLGGRDRVLRTGFFARLLAERGHEVTWWTSAFDHFKKVHLATSDTTVDAGEGVSIRMLYGRGYQTKPSGALVGHHGPMP